ncbi:BNR-4 repeat-containing protein [Algibacter mikhailovii]|uniref:BNR-4 repeat-containing protein n=1 Tax=Algibacter mikhailovii TaxID=425498 RepID=UPI0024950124|nr:BNR-4 repeat-containing protein [Algibacter mikhailovii]
MKKYRIEKISNGNTYLSIILVLAFILVTGLSLNAQVTLEVEKKITDLGLHFDGSKVTSGASNPGDSAPYDYFFGRSISAHGDCIKTYQNYVFMTWYRGGKSDRHVMLTRYNTTTGVSVTIEFPHRHTGYQNKYWIGESHNSIAVAVSPLDGTIHMLYDMHAYSRTRPSDGSLSNDYFRYSYSIKEAASLPDAEFTLDKFVKNSSDGYKHLSLNSGRSGYPDEEYSKYSALTYPQFFTNDLGDIFMYMREGGNNNGAYKFSKYDAATSTWSDFTHFNVLNAKNQPGVDYNWGLYGNMKYVDGKIRIGFQRRENKLDKFEYQNGVYYAYSDDQSGASGWKNHQGQSFNLPLYDADFIKVMEPGDYVQTTQINKVHIVSDFDWTVTDKGDVHIISRVKDNQYNVTKFLHTYKPAGASDFITSEDFAGGTSIYTSGDDVFIIGLKNNRVFIQRATGGTNNFETVYQPTSGKTFDHGRVHINNGKLYYYLMEKKSGNAQPVYLQIIDLDIIKEPFRVSLKSPIDGETYFVDETTSLSAEAIDENGSISKVEFWVNGTYFSEDNSEPYSVDWTPNEVGSYTIQAIAYNASAEMVSSSVITVNTKVFDPNDLTGDIYRIKNFVTGKYLHSVGADVVESDTGTNVASGDKEWEFVKAGNFYNIESKRADRGILRAAGNPPNDIINTGFGAPREDGDKQFNVVYNAADNSYQFRTRNNVNYIYHNANGIIEHVANSDDRSKWIVESTTLSLDNNTLKASSIKVYPNPASTHFMVALEGITSAEVIISDILGKVVYKAKTDTNTLQIQNDGKFKSGIYIIRVFTNSQNSYNTKLIVK